MVVDDNILECLDLSDQRTKIQTTIYDREKHKILTFQKLKLGNVWKFLLEK